MFVVDFSTLRITLGFVVLFVFAVFSRFSNFCFWKNVKLGVEKMKGPPKFPHVLPSWEHSATWPLSLVTLELP